jgi:hypothetical protein
MNWVKYEKNNCDMPELELNSPATETVWIRTDNHYASKYGVGNYEYDGDGNSRWYYDGCTQGFNVTHWAAIVPPEGERY